MAFRLVNLDVEWQPDRAVVRGDVLREDGSLVLIDWPVIVVNPPLLVPDGDGGYREDRDEAIRRVVLSLAEQVG
jgi:hypothetical protein